jgi:tripartite-type tricarboxylate transporter receptor subunit TctC
VSLATNSPNLLVAHPSFAASSVKELISLAKAKPGSINYASSPAGSSTHIAAELFKFMAGVNIVRVPYRGNAPALTAILASEAQIMFPNAGAAVPHIKAGRLKALAITSAQPSKLFPNLPTVAAAGLPGYQSGTMIGVFVPARTPASVVAHLNREIVRVLNRSDVKEKFAALAVDAVGSSSAEFAHAIKEEIASTIKLIKETGMKGE